MNAAPLGWIHGCRLLAGLGAAWAGCIGALLCSAVHGQSVVAPPDAGPIVEFAAREIRRYVYLRTGERLPIVDQSPAAGNVFLLLVDPRLAAQEYQLSGGNKAVTIRGGSDIAVLYGAYRYAERLGVRFYLHGDVIPDLQLAALPEQIEERARPLFETRGIQPFHDFPEGPDWWNQDDYLAYVGQLAKLRMNFIGLHCYPEGGVGPEPLVWIGPTDQLDGDGRPLSAYPAEWATTDRRGMWGYASMPTSDYCGGAAQLFPQDIYGPDVMAGLAPRPATPESSIELFDRVGRQLGVVFHYAQRLGIQTCLGTETPLTIPENVAAQTRDRRELYRGMFQRIAQVSPADYFWLWTPEGWTWSGNTGEQFEATVEDIEAALGALHDLGDPMTLATCGWVLGPASDRTALDAVLPPSSPLSCINRDVGHDGVEPAFAAITGRPTWAIPWMENDPNLVGPQPWVARMRYDAADALRFGCTGLLGIHWRTKALDMNIAALAAAGWDQSWVPESFARSAPAPQPNPGGALGGVTAQFHAPVADAAEPRIYQTVRYNLTGYDLQVPNGRYTVTLQFNEPHYGEAGKRVFGAKVQGQTVVEHLDLFARQGRNRALDLSISEIDVLDGRLRIELTPEVEYPCIAGIVVTGQADDGTGTARPMTRKINCGGGAVADYQADRLAGAYPPPAPRDRGMPTADFYADYARAQFGPRVAKEVAPLLQRIDGLAMPQVSDWRGGPGGLGPDPTDWNEVSKRFAFIDQMQTIRRRVRGAGNLERFDYWLNTYRAAAAMAQASCLRGRLDAAVAAERFDEALAARLELARVWTRLLSLQTAIVSTPGELGTIANLEQHTRLQQQFITRHDAELEKGLGRPLPPEAQPGETYLGPSRIVVPTVRTAVGSGESLDLKILVLDRAGAGEVLLHHRGLGQGDWQTLAANPVGRANFHLRLPPLSGDTEYYITAKTHRGDTLTWPATAPSLNQTVVLFPK